MPPAVEFLDEVTSESATEVVSVNEHSPGGMPMVTRKGKNASNTRRIVTVTERPDLGPVVSRWLWEEWRRADGHSLEETIAKVAKRTSASGPEQCFVLLADGAPVATASLVQRDLPARPDLRPWLAEVFVEPKFRRRALPASW